MTIGGYEMNREYSDGSYGSTFSRNTELTDETSSTIMSDYGGSSFYDYEPSYEGKYGPAGYESSMVEPSSFHETKYNPHGDSRRQQRFTPSTLRWHPKSPLLRSYFLVVPKGQEEPYLELLPEYTPTFEAPQQVSLDVPR
jgi:hypothetical protein